MWNPKIPKRFFYSWLVAFTAQICFVVACNIGISCNSHVRYARSKCRPRSIYYRNFSFCASEKLMCVSFHTTLVNTTFALSTAFVDRTAFKSLLARITINFWRVLTITFLKSSKNSSNNLKGMQTLKFSKNVLSHVFGYSCTEKNTNTFWVL